MKPFAARIRSTGVALFSPIAGPTVDASLVIEEAARLLSAEGREAANVVSSKGRHLGVLTMADIVAAMVPPREPVGS